MPTFLYRGYNAQGHMVGGCLRCASRARMETQVGKRGVADFQLIETKTLYRDKPYATVSPGELAVFCREMAMTLSSPLTVMEGLTLLAEQTANGQLKLALTEVYGLMSKGFTFAGAMIMYDHIFGAYLLHMIGVGEAADTLDSVLVKMHDFFIWEARNRKQLASALYYPAVRLCLMVFVILLVYARALPFFESIYDAFKNTRPDVTDAVFWLGRMMNRYLGTVTMVLVGLWLVGMVALRVRPVRRWADKQKLTLPVLRGIFARLCVARFARGTAIMLKHGIPFEQAAAYIGFLVHNAYLAPKLLKAFKEAEGGKALPTALAKVEALPDSFLQMLTIGYGTGRMGDMMEHAADRFADEFYDAITKTTVWIEPGLTLILAALAGVMLFAVIAPMTAVVNVIG